MSICLAPILLINKSSEIILNDYHTNKIKITDFLEKFFCKDVISIIITYYISKLHWKYEQSYKDVPYYGYRIIDNDIIYFPYGFNYLEINTLIANENIIIDKLLTISDIFVDSPYIYVISKSTVLSVHYYNKNIQYLDSLFKTASKYFTHNYINFVKNKIFYMIDLNYPKRIVAEDGEYTIKNINLPENIFKKIKIQCGDKHLIENIYVHTDDDIAVTIETSSTFMIHEHLVYNVSLENNINLLCIEISDHRAIILHYDGEYVIYVHENRDRDVIFCYSKFDNKVYKCHAEGSVWHASKDIILLCRDDRIIVYQS